MSYRYSVKYCSQSISLMSEILLWQCARACLKNHSRDLQAPLCGIFYPHSVAVARYAYVFKVAHSNPYPACMGYSYL